MNQQQNNDYFKNEYYTEADYQELQRNLVLYKAGNAEAVTYIVKTFDYFLTKYTRFIINGDLMFIKYKDSKGVERMKVDPSLGQFVGLFINKTEVKDKSDKKKVFSATCMKIKTLFSKYEYDDIYNELVLALLNMANKYKITKPGDAYHKENGTFHMYVSKCFHWEAHRFLKKLIKDPLTHLEMMHLCDQFSDITEEEQENGVGYFIEDEKAQMALQEMIETASRESDIKNSKKLTLKEDDPISSYDIEALNFNWTNGITCSELFKCLTPYEREIIVLSYIKNKNDIEIGNIYGYHRSTVTIHRKKAVEKIKAVASEMKILN